MTTKIEMLMVEDNRGDIVLVQEAMTKAGFDHHITVVRDGVEALAYLHRQGEYAAAPTPDLIVLDLKLPRKSGLEVLDAIRPDPVLREIPLIILSSSRSELEIAQAQHLPMRSYMVKPSTFSGYVDLVRAIEDYRKQAAAQAQQGDQP
jgi:two-component system, chemotaxis family, response regulator Rcp1